MTTKRKQVTDNGHTTNQRMEQAVQEMTANALMTRQNLLRLLVDPRRDLDHECGYPATGEITPLMLQDMYDREGVGTRVVEVFPLETWKVQPFVYEDEDQNTKTEFEQAWKELGRRLTVEDGEDNLYDGEEGNALWEYLRRIDVLSGIGHFGVILLGFGDGRELSEPVKGTKNELLYVRCFPESLVDITQFESDRNNPRYGKPNQYLLTLNDPNDSHTGIGIPQQTVHVHWSRVIHITETMTSSELFAAPRMRPVFNYLLNLRKLYGGSAEMYWRGAFPGLSIETHPQLGGDVAVDNEAIKDAMEQYQNGLQRYFALMGMSAKSLAPQVVDPSPQIRTQLEAICIRLGCPLRIFLGSERGELASSQDDRTWTDRIRDRQKNYVTPRIIVPFISRLIALGALPRPQQFYVNWPDLDALSPAEQAQVALTRTDAMVKYVSGGANQLMEPRNYLIRELKFEDAEADEILEATTEFVEQKNLEMEEAGYDAMGNPIEDPEEEGDDAFEGEGEDEKKVGDKDKDKTGDKGKGKGKTAFGRKE